MNNCLDLEWSEAIPLLDENRERIPNAHGVYRLIIVDAKGNTIPILRRSAEWDDEGIMYIGGTTTSGTIKDRFYRHCRAHSDGMNGKIEKDGKEQDLVALWRAVRSTYPGAGLVFQYVILEDLLTSRCMEVRLHAAYCESYGETPESGEASMLHNPNHPWREYLASK